MKNIFAGLFCVGLCISVAIFLPQTGTSNPGVDDTGCLVSGCHDAGFGEGTLHDSHSVFDCDSCHESSSGGGPVSSSSCLECHPDAMGLNELCDLVDVHPESAGCLECHSDCDTITGCDVEIDCGETDLCTDGDCTTCEATTECDGIEVEGEYTWSLDGEVNTGNSVEICPEDLDLGDNTLTVVDTANGGVEDDETLTLEECGPTDCQIDVLIDSWPKSHWIISLILFRIETIGIPDLNLLTNVTIDCEADGNGIFPSITKTGKIIQPNLGTNTEIIWQSGILWPAVLTQSIGRESETCTVTVEGCLDSDTFELEYLKVFGIPVSK